MSDRDATNAEFDRLIEGKSVALVGPAPPPDGEDQSAEIDGHDLVARVNSYEDVVGGKGERFDLGYYNAYNSRLIQAGKETTPPVEWVCFKSLSARARVLPQIPYRSVRTPPDAKRLNMAPIAVYDLLQAGPEKVTLYGVTFYVGAEPYAVNYLKGKYAERDIRDVMDDTLMGHDQMIQRRYLRSLMEDYPNLTADARCLDVLDMDDDEFQDALDRVWPPSPRRLQQRRRQQRGSPRGVNVWRRRLDGLTRRVPAADAVNERYAARDGWELMEDNSGQ